MSAALQITLTSISVTLNWRDMTFLSSHLADLEYKDDEPRVIYSRGVPLSDSGFYLSTRYSPAAKKLLQTMDIIHVHHPFLSGRLALRYCRPRANPHRLHQPHTLRSVCTSLPAHDARRNESGTLASLHAIFLRSGGPCHCAIRRHGKSSAPVQCGSKIEVVPNGVDLKKFLRSQTAFPRRIRIQRR